jgi:hypothetical protein
MKQLLAWCTRRALDEQKAKYASTESANAAAIGTIAPDVVYDSSGDWGGGIIRFDREQNIDELVSSSGAPSATRLIVRRVRMELP